MKDWEAEEAPAVGMAQTCRVVFAARSQCSSRFIKDSMCQDVSRRVKTCDSM